MVADPITHATAVLTIDLDAIIANWRSLAARLRPGARCAAVVKADAYGLGADRVAPALHRAGCTRFVVATLDEGLALRPLLPGAEILVLSGPFAGTEQDILAADLLPVLNSTDQVAAWAAFAHQVGRRLPAALHIDTGMARLGLSHPQAAALAAESATLAALDLRLVMSHLACADDPPHPMNRRQLDAFNAARTLFPGIEGSLAASSGIFLGPDWHADWGRPGAALYGVQPTAGSPNPMAQVVRLEGKIIQLRDVDAGDSVGYGATHRMSSRGRLAIVAAGYADGMFRSLGNRGCGHLGEYRVPLVGRVSMDLIIFDVTGMPDGVIHPSATITSDRPPQYRRSGRPRCRHHRLRSADRLGPPLLPPLPGRSRLMNLLAAVGRVFLAFLEHTGRLAVFTAVAVSHCVRPPIYFRLIGRQLLEIGYYSLPVVGLTAIFTGMVLALQSHTGFSRFGAESAVATVVVLSMTRELGPVLAGLMVAGRIGAAMAAEIGTMQVTEQVDALATLSTNPFKYLVAPRIIAGLLMLPCLVLVADIIGVFGGFLVGAYQLGYNPATYIHSSWEYLKPIDVLSGLTKAAVFGFIISLMGCYNGYTPRAAPKASARRPPTPWCRRRS